MTVDDLWASINRIIEDLLATLPVPRRGLVSSVDTSKMRVKVQVQPDPTPDGTGISNWIPLASQSIGNGWGIMAAPPPGTQVVVIPTDGHADSAVAIATHWSNQQLPPGGHNAGEFWLYHQTGSFIKLLNTGEIRAQDSTGAFFSLPNDGAVIMQDKIGASVVLNNNGDVSVNGNLIVNGNILSFNGGKFGGTSNMNIQGYIQATEQVQSTGSYVQAAGNVISGNDVVLPTIPSIIDHTHKYASGSGPVVETEAPTQGT